MFPRVILQHFGADCIGVLPTFLWHRKPTLDLLQHILLILERRKRFGREKYFEIFSKFNELERSRQSRFKGTS